MILVTGGAFQGKLEFAQKTYGFTDGWIDGRNCGFAEIRECRGIHHFHEYIRRLLNLDNSIEDHRLKLPSKEALSETGFFDGFLDDLSALERRSEAFSDWLYRKNPDLIIVSNELGYGVVPMEKGDRLWRETVGRVCTRLAVHSDEVVRVVCGIGIWLKGESS
ncbi:MAG: bifunctional adenosylcobinamide kinase/adenosylcobinamide-phosphate guanylyltransferase [Lachnospiraceae bacterium]|nr:bifunctional adenosylcobinamide kinase/adenosylcobinamide-phosphate guanylyltransferase [Lachnospiraceae bacterium]